MNAPFDTEEFHDFELDGFDTRTERQLAPLVVLIWRIGCPTSRLAAPFFDRLQIRYPQARVVGVVQDSREDIDRYCRENGIAFRQLVDADRKVTKAFKVSLVPTYVLTDASGKVISGGVSWDKDKINELAARTAALVSAPVEPLVTEADDVPAFKPG
jgi:thiol-disulfide isomerase/thioredoxin